MVKKPFKNPYIEERRKNIQIARALIEKAGEISHKKIVAIMGMYGLREKTIGSHLKILEDGEFIEFQPQKKTWKYIAGKSKRAKK